MILALFVTTYIGGIIGEFKRGRIAKARKRAADAKPTALPPVGMECAYILYETRR